MYEPSYVKQAKLDYESAVNKFNNATGKDVDVAALELSAAKAKLDRVYQIAKESDNTGNKVG